MRLDFVRIFIDSTVDLFGAVIGPQVNIESVEMRPEPEVGSDVMAIIGLAGEAHGRVIFDMDLQTSIRVASCMMGEEACGMGALARSSIAELASMAIGQAISRINDGGTSVWMSPPTVVTGANLLSYDQCFETLVAYIGTACGEVRINITVQDLE